MSFDAAEEGPAQPTLDELLALSALLREQDQALTEQIRLVRETMRRTLTTVEKHLHGERRRPEGH